MKLTYVYVLHIGFGAIEWSCKMKNMISLSTTKAKNRGTINVGIKVAWIHNLMGEVIVGIGEDLGFISKSAPKIPSYWPFRKHL
jgi:hypothetical protein